MLIVPPAPGAAEYSPRQESVRRQHPKYSFADNVQVADSALSNSLESLLIGDERSRMIQMAGDGAIMGEE